MSERVICDRCEHTAVYSVVSLGFFEVCCRQHLSATVESSLFDENNTAYVALVNHESPSSAAIEHAERASRKAIGSLHSQGSTEGAELWAW